MNLATITTKDRPEPIFMSVRNAEASAAIGQGQPVCFVMNATNDGNDVVLANTGGAAKAHTLFAGVPQDNAGIANAAYGFVQVFGLAQKCVLVQRTRAGTTGTDVWASVASIAAGALCQIDTVNNAFATNATGAASNFQGFAILAESQAAIVSAPTSTSDTATVQTTKVKMFLRAM